MMLKNVFNILRVPSKIHSSNELKKIRFSSDRTIKWREKYQYYYKNLKLVETLVKKNIIVKYIKGNPIIINNSKN